MNDAMTTTALSEACHLLAVLFYDPAELSAENPDAFFTSYAASLQACPDELRQSAADLQRAYRHTPVNELRVDYAALFVGPFELLACPFGSVHLEKEYRLYGKTTEHVEHLYRQAGLEVSQDAHFVPDHIAVELEFAHYLLNRIAAGEFDRYAGSFTHFINHYLQPFARRLSQDIITHAQTDYYRVIGAMLARLADDLAGLAAMFQAGQAAHLSTNRDVFGSQSVAADGA